MARILTLVIEHVDGTKNTARVLPATKVRFERQFSTGVGTLAESKREEYVYWLAWDAEHASGKVVKPFNEWLDDIVDVDVSEESAPLEAAASPSELPLYP
jgi:hypothetical protein